MSIVRETVYARIFAFFSGLAGGALFKMATRRPDTWEGVAPEDQPALLMMQRRESAEYKRGFPTKWTLEIDLYLYVHTNGQQDTTVIPAQLMNPLLDAIEAAISPDAEGETCTLGGLVQHCAISGPIEISLGSLGDEAVAVVPLSILTVA